MYANKQLLHNEVIQIIKKLIKYSLWIYQQSKSVIWPIIILTIAGVLASLTNVFVALASKSLFDSAQYGKVDELLRSALVIISVVLLQTIMQSIINVLNSKISVGINNEMRLKLFRKLSGAQWQFFTKYHSGDLVTRLTSDTEAVVNGITSVLPDMIALIVNLAVSFIVLIMFDPMLALLAFILGPVSVIMTRLFSGKLSQYHLRIQETESASRGFIQERFSSMHVIKAFGLVQKSSSILSKLQQEKLSWVIKRTKLSAASTAFLTLSYWVGFLLALLWGSVKLSRGAATFGTITVFLQLVGQIQAPFTGLAYSIPQLVVMYASAGRLIELSDIPEEDNSCHALKWNKSGIIADKLEFSYDKAIPVLAGTSFNIQPSEFVAITGTSGKGKTTLIRLLIALLLPTGGSLRFYNPDTQDSADAGVATRSLVTYVPQGNTLFSGKIIDNVMLGNENASNNELIEALKTACIFDFVDSLPDGTATAIGENGYGLSEGQAQRLSIARALIGRKPVLIFDEATSALDAETELKLLKSIASISPRPTCIIITHRPAAIDFCDRVFNISEGVLKENLDLAIDQTAVNN